MVHAINCWPYRGKLPVRSHTHIQFGSIISERGLVSRSGIVSQFLNSPTTLRQPARKTTETAGDDAASLRSQMVATLPLYSHSLRVALPVFGVPLPYQGKTHTLSECHSDLLLEPHGPVPLHVTANARRSREKVVSKRHRLFPECYSS